MMLMLNFGTWQQPKVSGLQYADLLGALHVCPGGDPGHVGKLMVQSGGFQLVMGVPLCCWMVFVRENLKWMITRGTPMTKGNLHLGMFPNFRHLHSVHGSCM